MTHQGNKYFNYQRRNASMGRTQTHIQLAR